MRGTTINFAYSKKTPMILFVVINLVVLFAVSIHDGMKKERDNETNHWVI